MAEVHPSLRPEMRASQTPLAANGGRGEDSIPALAAGDDSFVDLDLSDGLMDRLQAKINEMVDLRSVQLVTYLRLAYRSLPCPFHPFDWLRADRESRLREMRAVIESLWEALRGGAQKGKDLASGGGSAEGREALEALWSGPNRLFRANIDAVSTARSLQNL